MFPLTGVTSALVLIRVLVKELALDLALFCSSERTTGLLGRRGLTSCFSSSFATFGCLTIVFSLLSFTVSALEPALGGGLLISAMDAFVTKDA